MIKKMVSLITILSFLGQFNLSFAESNLETTKLNISPIIQLVSYNNKFGKYPEMNGWGSASIINNNGIIISNNHVVDNGEGGISDFFSVCITEKNGEKPNCKYTASLINRDKDMDISILKIDQKDIYGINVDYSNFKTIELDYVYVPKNQDEVFAVGYPWIGAESITETKGIISGISSYNNFNYIKTDATIAGGNSGGALIRNNKLIGIPTFTHGGDSDSTLGYALSIADAKDFIEKNISKSPQYNKDLFNFGNYKNNLNSINSSKKLKDLFFDISLNSDYEIKNYVENRYIEIGLNKLKNKTIVGGKLYLLNIPNFSEKGFQIFLGYDGFYSNTNYNLIKTTISNQIFFYPKNKYSLGNEAPFIYFGQIGKDKMLILELEKGNIEEINDYKKELEEFTKMLKFDSNNIDKINFEFKFKKPDLEIIPPENSYIDSINGEIISYVKDLSSRLSISIEKLEDWNGKNINIDEIYDIKTKEIQEEYKSKIKLKGYSGFIYCQNNNLQDISIIFEEKNNESRIVCNYNIYGLENNKYYLNIQLNSEQSKILKNLDYINKYLEFGIKLPENGNNETNLVNIYKNQTILKFKDLGNQSNNYKNKLKLLVKYNLLQNKENFEPYKALTREEFIGIFVRYVYNIEIDSDSTECKDYVCKFKKYNLTINGNNTNLYNILAEMKIPFKKYVPINKTRDFYSIFQLKLAGVNTENITKEDISNILNDIDSPKYIDIKNKLRNFNKLYFGEKQIKVGDLVGKNNSFNSIKNILSDINNNIHIETKDYLINFGYEKNNKFNDYENCLNSKNFSEFIKCNKDYSNKYNLTKIEIITKSRAIDEFTELMDFSLFDKNLID